MSKKGKKVYVVTPDSHENSRVIDPVVVEGVRRYVEENIVKDESDDIFLDDAEELSLDDAARVLDVSVPVAKLWMLHGHMTSIGTKGFVRVSRESVKNCYKRFIMGRV